MFRISRQWRCQQRSALSKLLWSSLLLYISLPTHAWLLTQAPALRHDCIDRVVASTLKGRTCASLTDGERLRAVTATVNCLCTFFGFRSEYCQGAPRDSTNLMMTAYTFALANWPLQCQWRVQRAALADSENSLNGVLAREQDGLARARATLATSRNTYEVTRRSYAKFMHLLDVDAGYRQQMRRVAVAAEKFKVQKEEMYRNLVSWGEMEEEALRAVDKAVRGVARRSKEEIDAVQKKDEAALGALGVHAFVALAARGFGVGARLSARQWSLQLGLVVADAALVIEGSNEACWSLRQAALIALVLQVVHNILNRARPRTRRRRRVHAKEVAKRDRRRDRAMRQALFLVRSLRGAGLDAPLVAAGDAFCWNAKQWPDPREWEPE